MQRRPERQPSAPPAGRGVGTGRRPEDRPEGVTFTAAGALLVMFVATCVGVLVDTLTGPGIGLATTILLTGSALAAAWLVRRRDLVTVAIAPPLILALVSVLAVAVLPDLSFSLPSVGLWLVYGFPAMAFATLAALLVAGLRLMTGR